MRVKKKGNEGSKTRAGQINTPRSFSVAKGEAANGFSVSSCHKTQAEDFVRRCLELVFPDGTILTAMAVENCSDPSLDVTIGKDGYSELVCRVQYNPDYPERQRLRIAAYRHDCDFASYEEPFVAEEIDDEA